MNKKSLPKVRGVPPIVIDYEREEHRDWPHVVKLSGGRSSAALLLGLLYGGQLRPSRGDVIVFNNTSAEYPATYTFAAACKRIAERRFNIPCFWVEFQTYEDVWHGRWRRLPGYRLVQPYRHSTKRPRGYRCHGEAFEELISWKRQLPTRFTRLCTQHLKLQATALFLQDWFGRASANARTPQKASNRRLGHWHPQAQVDAEAYGKLQDIARYHLEQPHSRPPQRYQDFTSARLTQLRNRNLAGKVYDNIAPLKGERHVKFLSLVGLRADEPRRVANVLERNNSLTGEENANRLADGEYIYAPLFTEGIGKQEVLNFWQHQTWDLKIPHNINLSNCVYCFMKGERALREIAQADAGRCKNTAQSPAAIQWWADIEHRYARKQPSKANPKATTRFGFFGANAPVSYREIIQTLDLPIEKSPATALPCDCTD